jgi:EAL domain-containing protein (putative c-di-GMP-specific phosphodiesterase class I)
MDRKSTFGPVLAVSEPDRAVTDLLEAVRHRLRMDVAWLARSDGDLLVIEAIDGDNSSFGVQPGTTIHVSATSRPPVMTGGPPQIIRDVRGIKDQRRSPAARALRAGAYVAAPVFERDGAFYGTLSALSHDRRPDLQERDARFLCLAAEMITDSVSDLRRVWEGRRAFWDRVGAVIDAGGPTIVFQPIADLGARDRIIGVEALARFPPFVELCQAEVAAVPAAPSDEAPPSGECPAGSDQAPSAGPGGGNAVGPAEPERWFAAAAAVGLGVELELAAVRAALARLPRLPADLFLSVNVSPGTVGAELAELIRDVDPSRLLLEITEHNRLEEESAAFEVLREIRARGVRIGADDVGSGYAGLSQFLMLRPDLVKMDRFLTHGIDADPARQVIAGALIRIADEIGASMLAEGIETPQELATVRAARVRLGQGNYIAPPSDLPVALAT